MTIPDSGHAFEDDDLPARLDDDASAQLVQLLARGIPAGLTGVGIDPTSLTPESLICTVNASISGVRFDAKSGGLVVAFLIPAEHQYIALPLREASRRKLTVSVHAPAQTRGLYGVGAATVANQKDRAAVEARDRVLKRHTRRQLDLAMAQWVGPANGD